MRKSRVRKHPFPEFQKAFNLRERAAQRFTHGFRDFLKDPALDQVPPRCTEPGGPHEITLIDRENLCQTLR